MPRYLVVTSYTEVLDIPCNEEGAVKCQKIIDNNLLNEVTWIYSYISHDKEQAFCIYVAPSPESIRRVAKRNNLPVIEIYEVHLLDPYFNR